MYYTTARSPLGMMTMTADDEGLTGLWFIGCGPTPSGAETPELPVFRETARWLELYFSGREPDFAPTLHLIGTPFQCKVWACLLEIPYGTTRSYGELAKRLSSSARAVGGAVSRNPVWLIVPCHRVIGSDGRLNGYAGGMERKRALLETEKISMRSAERA